MKRIFEAAVLAALLLAGACAPQQHSATPPPVARPAPTAQPAPAAEPDIYLIYFAFDSTEISPVGQVIVDQIATNAKARPPTRITVNGYADRVGPAGYNQEISEERAESVVQALRKQGVNVNMRKLGMGEEQSIDASVGGRHVAVKLFRD